LRGERYAAATEILVGLPQQRQFSHSPSDMDTYCPLLGLLVGDIWYSDFNCKFILAAEQRREFALGFVEAAAIAISAEDRAFQSIIDIMNSILVEKEKAAVVQLLVKHLLKCPQTEELQDIIQQLQQSKLFKLQTAEWDLPVRDLSSQTIKDDIDPEFVAASTKLQATICETMGWTIDDAEMLLEKSAWGVVQHLFATSRATNFDMVDRVWLKAIDAKKENLMFMIYDQGYPIIQENTRYMDCTTYGDVRNPFANMVKSFPDLILKSSRTDEKLAPVNAEDYTARAKYSMFRQGVVDALVEGLDDRKFVKSLERCKLILDRLFPADVRIKEDFYYGAISKLSKYGRGEVEIGLLKANWPWSA
jgi:hypothetical protein